MSLTNAELYVCEDQAVEDLVFKKIKDLIRRDHEISLSDIVEKIHASHPEANRSLIKQILWRMLDQTDIVIDQHFRLFTNNKHP